MKRTALKPIRVPLERHPMRHQSSKRVADYKTELDALTPQLFARSRGQCELCRQTFPLGLFERHHRKRRSQGGQNVMSNVLVLCRGCHLWAHANPREAKLLGLLVSRWDDPRTVPVLSR